MGHKYTFRCPACAYLAKVFGGPNAGELVTTTIVCLDCKKLFDIVTGNPLQIPGEKPPKRRCPKKASHRIKEWKNGDPCPIC
ncbi:MAG: hypothetical protein WC429_23655, partial [Verrucomicrobiia bacterium]